MSLEFVVLRCLCDGPAHGYLLRRGLAAYRHVYPLSNVNIYAVLRSLGAQGRVRSSTELVGPRARRVYSITDDGRKALSEWIASPPENALADVRDPIALRFAMARDGSEGFTWLPRAIEEVAAEADRVQERLAAEGERMTPVARLAAEALVTGLKSRRAFLERVLETHRAADPEPD